MSLVRILFVSDTHLGFDDPDKPRVQRRRRGPDFFANFERALAPALRREVDLVVHGGDLLYRSRVSPSLVERAFRPLKAVAETGVPVYVVPGNHERSRIPYPLLATHENIFVLDRPRTYLLERDGLRLALGGFPFIPRVREAFKEAYRATGLDDVDAHASILLLHHAVEGARVGPSSFTFRHGSDVIRARDVPARPNVVLSGHIHRAQALVDGLASPVVYAGSVERTSFAERDERKGFLTVAIEKTKHRRGRLVGWRFHELPARPMFQVELPSTNVERHLRARLATLPRDAIVQILPDARGGPDALPPMSRLRALAPATMNLSVSLPLSPRPRRGAESE